MDLEQKIVSFRTTVLWVLELKYHRFNSYQSLLLAD